MSYALKKPLQDLDEENAFPSTFPERSKETTNRLIQPVILAGLIMIAYGTVTCNFFDPVFLAVKQTQWSTVLVRPCILWLLMGFLLLSFRTILWFFYKPFPSATQDAALSLTVIIPAYNEGAMVRKAIDSVASDNYPRHKLEILVIDDGSRDDTWEHIHAASMHYGKRLTAIRFPVNRGKRAALETGFRYARGEIVVTIDSDSVIETGTLLAICGPFRNRKVAAVAGKVAVYNRYQGLIPRMLHVRYILSFDFLRAVQSAFGTVYCCPGALSAYRVSVVRRILGQWMSQRFLGRNCTYGEDRALTNLILAQGYDAVYQRTAVVHTVVPWTYEKLCKMYLRWNRSYVREEILFARKIVWRRPLVPCLVAVFDKLITNLRFPVGYATIGLLGFFIYQDPITLLRLLLTMGLVSCFHMFYYLRSEASWDFVYGILYAYFSFFGLFWIFPYAVFTVRSRSWMTR